MKRNTKGQLASCSYEEAFEAIAKKLGTLMNVAGLASGKASTEALKAFADLMTKSLGSKLVDTLDGDDFRTVITGHRQIRPTKPDWLWKPSWKISSPADTILIIGAHPIKTHPVIGSYIMRAASKNKAQLVVLDPLRNPFTFRASGLAEASRG